MKRIITLITLMYASSGCYAQDAFDDARDLAREIIKSQLEGDICNPEPIPAEQRLELKRVLSDIESSGLTDSEGLDPVNLAVIADDVPTIDRLASLGYALDAPGNTFVHGAAFTNSLQALSFLIDNGADPNAVNSYNATPLMVAAANGRLAAARELLAAAASPDARNNDGGSALHYAIGCKNQKMVDVLLAAGASVDTKAQELADRHEVTLGRQER